MDIMDLAGYSLILLHFNKHYGILILFVQVHLFPCHSGLGIKKLLPISLELVMTVLNGQY